MCLYLERPVCLVVFTWGNFMKIVVTIPAYNVAKYIETVVIRVLHQNFVDKIIIVDDCSRDSTYEIIRNLQEKHNKVKAIHHKNNMGYGGAQKTLYSVALEDGADIIVLLHADGQHLPEELPMLLEPLKNGECDIVVGSRALGHMLRGGMPLYKFIGNKLLTFFENFAFG